MAENTAEVIADISEESIPTNDIFDGWDDDYDTGIVEETTETEPEEVVDKVEDKVADNEEADTEEVEEADQPTETESVEDITVDDTPKGEEPKAETKESDQTYELKHLDETKKVSLDEMKSMAQKGWDYDRLKSKNDALIAENSRLKLLEDFLNNIKGDDFKDITELIDDTNADILVKSEAKYGRPLEKEEALKRVKANRESVWKEAEQKNTNSQQAIFEDFARTFPDLDPKTIPQDVWNEFNVTGDLKGAYRQFKMAELGKANKELTDKVSKLESEIKTLKQNEKNKQRSTGSTQSVGNKTKANPMFEGWDD